MLTGPTPVLTDPSFVHPAYLRLGCDALASRARRAVATLADCRAWPRDCGVNRLEDRWAACKTGRYAVVSSFFPHFGEEDCLRGWNGSGTIFFVQSALCLLPELRYQPGYQAAIPARI